MAVEILSAEKVGAYIKQYVPTKLHNIGNNSFLEKYSNLLKLHKVAITDASTNEYERVKDAFLKYNKVDYLVKDLVTVSVWNEKVLPELLKLQSIQKNSLTHMVLYQESVLVGLLQYLLFHPVRFSDIPYCSLTDLVDYCAYKLVTIPKNVMPNDANIKLETDFKGDISKYHGNLSFIVTSQCISIIRFICENLHNLPFNIELRIYSTLDIAILIVHLFDSETWSKRIDGKIYKFCGYSWQQFPDDTLLSKTEVQILMLVNQLLMKSIRLRYTINNYRKLQLSRLLKYLNDKSVEQIKPLSDLKHWLLVNCSSDNQGTKITYKFTLDTMFEYREILYSEYEGKWTNIALDSSKFIFNDSHIEMKKISNEFIDFLDNVSDMIKTCLMCFSKADKKCSKCKNAWYCSKKCQLKHWSDHQPLCQI